MSCNCCAATDMSCRVSLSELSNSAQQPDCTQPDNIRWREDNSNSRSEEHTSELQSHSDIVCRLLLEKKKKKKRKRKKKKKKEEEKQ